MLLLTVLSLLGYCASLNSKFKFNLQMYWNNPYLCDVVSMPPPMTRPPMVKSSNSGTTGKVQPFAICQKYATWFFDVGKTCFNLGASQFCLIFVLSR